MMHRTSTNHTPSCDLASLKLGFGQSRGADKIAVAIDLSFPAATVRALKWSWSPSKTSEKKKTHVDHHGELWLHSENLITHVVMWMKWHWSVDVSWSKMTEFWKLCSQKDGKVNIPWLLFVIIAGVEEFLKLYDGFIHIYIYIHTANWLVDCDGFILYFSVSPPK